MDWQRAKVQECSDEVKPTVFNQEGLGQEGRGVVQGNGECKVAVLNPHMEGDEGVQSVLQFALGISSQLS